METDVVTEMSSSESMAAVAAKVGTVSASSSSSSGSSSCISSPSSLAPSTPSAGGVEVREDECDAAAVMGTSLFKARDGKLVGARWEGMEAGMTTGWTCGRGKLGGAPPRRRTAGTGKGTGGCVCDG